MIKKIFCEQIKYAIFFCSVGLFLQGCASSAASRGASHQTDQAYLDARYQLTHQADGLRDGYQNSSQTTKGVLIGGVVGGAAGGATSGGVGIAPGIGLGAIFGGAIGAYIDSHTTLQDKLQNRGVIVITLGDQVLIVVPSAVIFYPMSSNLLPAAYGTLDLVRIFINQMPNMSVKVAGYTSAIEPRDVSFTLSRQQAQKVVRFLWNRGIDTRLLFAEGYGGSKLVSPNTLNWGSDNYRIEITLEQLIR